jgi:hypothetical protein
MIIPAFDWDDGVLFGGILDWDIVYVTPEPFTGTPYPLSAISDDFNLNALGDTFSSSPVTIVSYYYLQDTAGNYLTDTAGNRLFSGVSETVYPIILHALPDDFNLNTE